MNTWGECHNSGYFLSSSDPTKEAGRSLCEENALHSAHLSARQKHDFPRQLLLHHQWLGTQTWEWVMETLGTMGPSCLSDWWQTVWQQLANAEDVLVYLIWARDDFCHRVLRWSPMGPSTGRGTVTGPLKIVKKKKNLYKAPTFSSCLVFRIKTITKKKQLMLLKC